MTGLVLWPITWMAFKWKSKNNLSSSSCICSLDSLLLESEYSTELWHRIFASHKNAESSFVSLSGIQSLFHHSSKRTYVAESTIDRQILSSVETRWSSHSKLLSVVIQIGMSKTEIPKTIKWSRIKQIAPSISI